MSTDAIAQIARPSPVGTPLAWRELSELLVKHYGLHEGTYSLWVEFAIGTGPIGPNKEKLMPGVMVGVARVGLIPADSSEPATVDAGIVNRKRQSRKKAK